uniref:Uncharacterized protein n=1 Tax=Eutreptiella gymnastica TaxID=73025 RepID=A0A7S4C7D5_9EUGL
MGNSDSKPANAMECLPQPVTGANAGATGSTGHWLRKRHWLPGMWCYEGSVCTRDRLTSLEGYTVYYGGPQTCGQAGYTLHWGDEDRFDTRGSWYQP